MTFKTLYRQKIKISLKKKQIFIPSDWNEHVERWKGIKPIATLQKKGGKLRIIIEEVNDNFKFLK
jgi:hypothetical protein